MWNNYLILTFRNIMKFKLHAFINIFGLGIGIAISILIFLFIIDEYSFDQFHSAKERILRIDATKYSYNPEIRSIFDEDNDGAWTIAWMPLPLAQTIKEEIPDILRATRWDESQAIFRYEDMIFEESIHYVDPDFFLMFDFNLVAGDPNTVLNNKYNLVISESVKTKYFKNETAIGKEVQLNVFGKDESFIISGIIEDPPPQSSLEYSILLHQEIRPFYGENYDNWQSYNTPTFVEIGKNTDTEQFNKRLLAFRDKYFAEELREMKERNKVDEDLPLFELGYTPLTGIHLDTEVSWHKSSDPLYSYILGALGILILFIASINYISLSLSNSSGRTKEVGIRKVLGANRKMLTWQFWAESQLLVFIALFTGILLSLLLTKPFNEFTGKSLSLFSVSGIWLIVFLIILSFIVGLFAGGYPAVFLSRFHPIKVLNNRSTGRFNANLTRFLVIIQYAVSGFLIISSLIMYQQMNYITRKDLGFDKEQLLVVPTYTGWSDEGEQSVKRIRNALLPENDVLSVSGVSTSFNRGWSRNAFEIDGEEHSAFTYRIDPFYIKTLDLEIIDGRNFDPNRPSDINAIIVNEALANDYDWEDPIGEHLYWRSDSTSSEIIGIVKNYHNLSLEETIEPLILHLHPKNGKITTCLIKIGSENIPATLNKIEKQWKNLNPDKPFEYSFLDQDIQNQYASYLKWMKIMTISTILAILIACMGLFGLAGINVLNRLKEISIRKVLGAGASHIFMLMNREVFLLAIISFIIAIPISYYIMEEWLSSFNYRIDIHWTLFLIAILTGTIIAVLTVSYHVLKATFINPADILRDE